MRIEESGFRAVEVSDAIETITVSGSAVTLEGVVRVTFSRDDFLVFADAVAAVADRIKGTPAVERIERHVDGGGDVWNLKLHAGVQRWALHKPQQGHCRPTCGYATLDEVIKAHG